MKEGFIALHIRKTEESRNAAQKEIEKWHTALEIVLQAELKAECKIDLQPILVDSLAIAKDESPKVGHIAAVGLIKQAADARSEITKVAKSRLKAEIEARRIAEKSLANEIELTVKQKDKTVSQVRTKFEETIGEKPWLFSSHGCSLGCAWLILSSVILIVVHAYLGVNFKPKDMSAQSYQDLLVLSLFISSIFITLIGSLTISPVLWNIKKRRVEAERDRAISLIEQDTARGLLLLKENRNHAEQQLTKAEDAFKFLMDKL